MKYDLRPIEKLPCPAEGVDLRKATNWITYYHNIPAWEFCGSFCEDYVECKGWTWNSEEPDLGECNLWDNVEKTTEVTGKISGLKDCPV